MKMEFEIKRPWPSSVDHINVRLHYVTRAHLLPEKDLHFMGVVMPNGQMLADENGKPCNVYYEYCQHANARRDPTEFVNKFKRVAANFQRFF